MSPSFIAGLFIGSIIGQVAYLAIMVAYDHIMYSVKWRRYKNTFIHPVK